MAWLVFHRYRDARRAYRHWKVSRRKPSPLANVFIASNRAVGEAMKEVYAATSARAGVNDCAMGQPNGLMSMGWGGNQMYFEPTHTTAIQRQLAGDEAAAKMNQMQATMAYDYFTQQHILQNGTRINAEDLS